MAHAHVQDLLQEGKRDLPPWDAPSLTQEQRTKMRRIMVPEGARGQAMLLPGVSRLQSFPEGTVCLSILPRSDKQGKITSARHCFVLPTGRHAWG